MTSISRETNEVMPQPVPRGLAARFPELQTIIGVFAVTAFLLYGWTFLNVAWKIRSWLYNLTSSEIFALLSYAVVFNFLESSVVIAGLLGLCFALPKRILRDEFEARSVIIIVCFLGSMILHLMINSTDDSLRVNFYQSLRLWWLITFILTTILAWFLPRLRVVKKALHEFADRATVFLFILMPLSLVGFIVIIFRFLFAA